MENTKIKINLQAEYNLTPENLRLSNIENCFKEQICELLGQMVSQLLWKTAKDLLTQPEESSFLQKLGFKCSKCDSSVLAIKTLAKDKRNKTLTTIFGEIKVPDIQLYCRKCKNRIAVTNKILGLGAKKRTDEVIDKEISLFGALTSFRNTATLAGLLGSSLSKTDFWRYTQKVGAGIQFGADPIESNEFQADGTGVPTLNSGKRGSELKVLIQRNSSITANETGSEYSIAGMGIGPYCGGWDKLIEPSLPVLQNMPSVYITLDGDSTILKGLPHVQVKVQRCLWHIPHQAKFTLWEDKIPKDSVDRVHVMSELYDMISVAKVPEATESLVIVMKRQEQMENLIQYCQKQKMPKTAAYLENAKGDLFTCITNKMSSRTTSKIERIMRTINMRTNVGTWSLKGVLNVNKIRLAYYYNGFMKYYHIS